MKKYFGYFLVLFISFSATAQEKEPVKVLLLGMFHFENPGLDVAKFKNADILSPVRQEEIMEVIAKLKAFSPDKIFIENVPEKQGKTDSLLEQYKKGKYKLTANENDQLGLRLAKELDLPSLYPVDYREADFPFDSLMKSAAEAGQNNIIENIQHLIDSVEKTFNRELERSTITQMLLRENEPASIRVQNEFYFGLIPAGKFGNHVGSYLVSEWWRRNMVICENIIKLLDGKEKRILVIFGSGHTALLNQIMQYNRNFELVRADEVLK